MVKGYTYTNIRSKDSNLAQGFIIIRWRKNESSCSNQRHIIVSSGRHKSGTPNVDTKFNISRKH